jgi:hypothetical protein
VRGGRKHQFLSGRLPVMQSKRLLWTHFLPGGAALGCAAGGARGRGPEGAKARTFELAPWGEVLRALE